jgi:hypothetical protein
VGRKLDQYGFRVVWAWLIVFALIWLTAPSQHLHFDALDDLHRLETGTPQRTAWHPVGEPAVYVFWRLWDAVSEAPTSIRAVQVWNGTWLTLALAGLIAFGRRWQASPVLVLGLVASLSLTYAGLHLARDPYLCDWPPALGLMTWALVLGDRSERVAALLIGMAAAFVPLCLIGAPLLLWGVDDERRPVRRQVLLAALAAGPLVVAIGSAWGEPYAGTARPEWAGLGLPAAVRGMAGMLTAQEQGFGALDVVDVPSSPAAWATALALGAGLITGAFGLLGLRSSAVRVLMWLWLAAAVGVALFVGWWGPGQVRFWLLPVWLLALGVLRCGLMDRRLEAAAVALAALLGMANGARYVLPTATTPDARVAQARILGHHFGLEDFLLFCDGGRPHVDYFGGLRSDGLEEALRRRPADSSCAEELMRLARETRAGGGRLVVSFTAEWHSELEASGCDGRIEEPDWATPGLVGSDQFGSPSPK